MGVNVGDVVAQDDDLLGDGVNIAARLETLCPPGGITISEDAYRQVRDRLDSAWEDGGEHEVKNIARPVRVWQWTHADIGAGPAPGAGRPLPSRTYCGTSSFLFIHQLTTRWLPGHGQSDVRVTLTPVPKRRTRSIDIAGSHAAHF